MLLLLLLLSKLTISRYNSKTQSALQEMLKKKAHAEKSPIGALMYKATRPCVETTWQLPNCFCDWQKNSSQWAFWVLANRGTAEYRNRLWQECTYTNTQQIRICQKDTFRSHIPPIYTCTQDINTGNDSLLNGAKAQLTFRVWNGRLFSAVLIFPWPFLTMLLYSFSPVIPKQISMACQAASWQEQLASTT